MGGLLFLLAVSLLCAAICHQVARRRGASTFFWGMMGLLFGPLAIPFVFFAQPIVR